MSISTRLHASTSFVTLLVGSIFVPSSLAQSVPETVVVIAHTALDGASINQANTHSSDTAALLSSVAGVSTYAAGGVSGLPAIHGMGADRVNILVDGMQSGVGCPNEMNSPLSYIDPSQAGSAKVFAGITPVSVSGDSIGGTIVVASVAPRMSTDGTLQVTGLASAYYRSNAHAIGGSVQANLAGEDFAIRYSAAMVGADNYSGGGHDGAVRSTEFESANHALAAAWRSGDNLVILNLSQQYIPREGYPNQWMDLLFNRSLHAKLGYDGSFDWGTLEASVYWQKLRHYMNFLDDKGGVASGGMPMNTRSETFGYTVKTTVNLSNRDTLRIGSELVNQSLDDWWPPVAGSMMMGPLTYENLNNGWRTRLGTFGEWQHQWNSRWNTLVGLRNDMVWMNTGAAQPYSWTSMMNMTDAMAAGDFNARPHARTDADFDVTALVRYMPNADTAYEFGYARKTRAPNFYERYAWGRGDMASQMIGWFGDGNGYVGNLDVKPEVANTISATGDWHGGSTLPWQIRLTPYYTLVDGYIDARKVRDLGAMGMPSSFVLLQFVNTQAELYGADLTASLGLWDTADAGKGSLNLTASWVRGTNTEDHHDLYHQMPLNATLSLTHRMGGWQGVAELVMVNEKSAVDPVRNEPTTSAYALLNLRTSYSLDRFRFDVGIENVFDTAYALPLGGVSLGDYGVTGALRPVPGMGRSINIGITATL
jgi:iron complex outermembrane recepter protein